jgi:hypothetical protein
MSVMSREKRLDRIGRELLRGHRGVAALQRLARCAGMSYEKVASRQVLDECAAAMRDAPATSMAYTSAHLEALRTARRLVTRRVDTLMRMVRRDVRRFKRRAVRYHRSNPNAGAAAGMAMLVSDGAVIATRRGHRRVHCSELFDRSAASLPGVCSAPGLSCAVMPTATAKEIRRRLEGEICQTLRAKLA